MAPPSKLNVATSVLLRLVKEEASYHMELTQQEARIKKIEADTEDENVEYQLKQERQALEETKNVFPSIRFKIAQAVQNLEDQLESSKEADRQESTEDVTKAKEAIAAANETLGKAS